MSSGIPITPDQRQLLADRMAQLGHTQTSLAAACDVSQPAVARILSGDRLPSEVMLGDLARELNMTFTFSWVLK